jgi:TRAP-type C4-dicarboxylate transport system substrate-binding protein
MKRTLAAAVPCLALALALSAAAEARTLKLNAGDSPGSLVETAMSRFKQLVEEGSNNELEVGVFMGAQLGGPQESLENLNTGTLELYGGDLSYYATLLPDELGIITLMYFFADTDHLRRYLTSPYFTQAIEEKLVEEHGIRFLSTEFQGDRGPYRVFVSTKPVMKVDDLEGVRMRLWPNDIVIRQWRYLGAVPTVLSWEEVYLSISQGTIDAVTGPLADMPTTHFTEVAPYVTELRQFPQILPIAISERVWQQLTPEHQELMVRAANQALAEYAELVRESGDAAKELMMARDDAVFIQTNLAPFREKMTPFYQTLISEGAIDKEAFETAESLR